MPLIFQGNWNVSVIGNQAGSLPQRFIVTGAVSGNGIYEGVSGNGIAVQGSNWQLNIQANESYEQNGAWINSSMRQTNPSTTGTTQSIIVESEDLIQDNSWNDLVLQLTREVSIPQPPPPPVTPIPTPDGGVVIIPPLPPPPVIPPTPPITLAMGKVFTLIGDSDRLPQQVNQVTYGIWLDNNGDATGNMVTFHTCSLETSGSYRRTVFQKQCGGCASEPHFAIAYGHDGGSGSRDLGGNDFYTPTNAVYGQYRGLCLDSGRERFKLGGSDMTHFYAINVAQGRMGDKLDEGNMEINIAHLSGSQFLVGNGNRNAHTGSNVRLAGSNGVLRLIDDSTLNVETELSTTAYSGFYQTISSSLTHRSTSAGKVFYMVSGTLETGIYNRSNPHVYGLSYPSLGIVLLDADKLDASASFLTVTGSDTAGDNAMKLFTAMSGAALLTDESGDYLGFQSRRVKYEYVEQYFIRIKNQDYNFTNNATFQTGSEGQIIDDFMNKPQTYITAIGLYNDNHELLAVAKPSKPITKNFTEESLFEICLTYE